MKKNYKCDFCDKYFGGPSALKDHESSHTRKLKNVECEICGKTILQYSLNYHMTIVVIRAIHNGE